MLLLLVLAAGCGPRLVPGPGANEVEGRGEGAVTSAKGIELVARARAWEGDPWNLSERVTPMLVTIANEGDVPVHIRYYDIRLFSDAGRAYFPLRPFAPDAEPALAARESHFRPEKFTYAPYFSTHFGDASRQDAFADPELPTADMARKALPEGVLQPGGKVSGFLYFEEVGPDVRRVRLLADFDNSETGWRVARLAIPFLML